MRRLDRSKQLPYLNEYIQYATDWRGDSWHAQLTFKTVGLGVGISFVIGLVTSLAVHIPAGGFLAASLAFCVYMLGTFAIDKTKRARDTDPQVELRREAKQVAQRLEASVGKKRLHRDLSIEVSSLLEEAARNWHRAKMALESPYWRAADLPAHLRAVREQSLLAIDQGMQEMLVLFSTSVPAKPGNWSFSEVVDEVLGQDMFATRGRVEHLSPFYDQGRGVAAKLHEMADQVETISRQLASQELITGAPKPGTALEATLAELRQLKQAEDELRQELRG